MFGDEKAFQPMTIDGAMSDNIEILKKGILRVLPLDAGGRGVLYADRVRMCAPFGTREELVR